MYGTVVRRLEFMKAYFGAQQPPVDHDTAGNGAADGTGGGEGSAAERRTRGVKQQLRSCKARNLSSRKAPKWVTENTFEKTQIKTVSTFRPAHSQVLKA